MPLLLTLACAYNIPQKTMLLTYNSRFWYFRSAASTESVSSPPVPMPANTNRWLFHTTFTTKNFTRFSYVAYSNQLCIVFFLSFACWHDRSSPTHHSLYLAILFIYLSLSLSLGVCVCAICAIIANNTFSRHWNLIFDAVSSVPLSPSFAHNFILDWGIPLFITLFIQRYFLVILSNILIIQRIFHLLFLLLRLAVALLLHLFLVSIRCFISFAFDVDKLSHNFDIVEFTSELKWWIYGVKAVGISFTLTLFKRLWQLLFFVILLSKFRLIWLLTREIFCHFIWIFN